ncbi:hypothetical protein TNIN_351001 [Trichonephila inaurata madagascariensis]|uniref:Uncharacterized protein n=1 Tax=Trichonephila inaurata madagascariensis TaxID=2747483 RepID=A0A8X6YJ41_9ARAC|nr:hypothetical protein TNIN_351001 [Trichonephila inaurata madagascariensis]
MSLFPCAKANTIPQLLRRSTFILTYPSNPTGHPEMHSGVSLVGLFNSFGIDTNPSTDVTMQNTNNAHAVKWKSLQLKNLS